MGISGPFPIRPWGDPLNDDPSDYYGYQPITGHPIRDASKNESSGGVVYFDGTPGKDDIEALFRLLNVHTHLKEYAVFVEHSDIPIEDCYLVQMRVVSRFALKYMFHALDEEAYESFSVQELNIGDVLWRFIEDQQETWGTRMGSRELYGVMGGDRGLCYNEALCFGYMVEKRL